MFPNPIMHFMGNQVIMNVLLPLGPMLVNLIFGWNSCLHVMCSINGL
jgi:hypothetical protein